MRKHSVSIRGHPTSVSVEDEFWDAFVAIARREQRPVAALIAQIDAARGPTRNLSSALRLHVLSDLQKQLGASDAQSAS